MSRFVLFGLTFRQIRKGAVLFAVLAAFLLVIQGIGIKEALPTPAERTQMIISFEANPVFKFIYNENDHADTPQGYMLYRSGQILALIGSLWILLIATKTLRGQEEDGQLEVLLVGRTILGGATIQQIGGIAVGILGVGLLVCAVLLAVPKLGIDLIPSAALWISLGFTGVWGFFASLGFLTSQLAPSRRLAVMYGVVPLVLFFLMRSIGNSIPDLHWLKGLTPFGWFDQVRPIVDAHPLWLVPLYAAAAGFTFIAVVIAGRRDHGSSVLRAQSSAKAHLALLKGSFGLAFRLTWGSLLGWGLGIVGVAALSASIATSAADALRESPSLSQAVIQITQGGTDLRLVFLSVGSMLMATLLLAMVANGVSASRQEEIRGLADNLLVRRVSRAKWLLQRSLLLAGAAVVSIAVASTVAWFIATRQGISLDWGASVVDHLAIMGIVGLFIGFGVLLVGWVPKAASFVLYGGLIWSFIAQIFTSLVKEQVIIDLLNRSSLLHYVTLAPANAPDWKQFWTLILIGVVLGMIGLIGFNRRDLQSE